MTPLKASEEALCTGGIRVRSETENFCAALCFAHLSAGQMLPGCGFDSVEGFNLASRLGFCCHFHQLEDLGGEPRRGCVCVCVCVCVRSQLKVDKWLGSLRGEE